MENEKEKLEANKKIKEKHSPLVASKTLESKNGTRGITLIALVITIIVLLILAAVSIATLTGDNGILKQAVKAKEETEKKSVQENIQLAVLSAMSNTNRELTLDNLITEVKNQLGSDVEVEQDGIGGYVVGKNRDENNHITDVYGVVDKEGKVGDGKWHFVKLTEAEETTNKNEDVIISDGVTQLIVGNIIDYSPMRKEDKTELTEKELQDKKYKCEVNDLADNKENYGGTYTYKVDGYKREWGVLGAEDGKILIIPIYNIVSSETKEMGTLITNITDLYLQGKKGYQNGIKALNDISKIYGYGRGAESARSITVEDVNKITGYDPNYIGQNVNKTKKEDLELKKYQKGIIYEYGNQVKYYWGVSNGNPTYEGSNGVTGILGKEHNIFNWYDGLWKESEKPSNTITKQYITTLTSTFYYYDPVSLETEKSESEVKGISKKSKAYKMLFEGTMVKTDSDIQESYWLGSISIATESEYASFGMRRVWDGQVSGFGMYYSDGREDNGYYFGARPVVTLRSDVTITKTGEGENETYKIN